jgi:hypothetical protein
MHDVDPTGGDPGRHGTTVQQDRGYCKAQRMLCKRQHRRRAARVEVADAEANHGTALERPQPVGGMSLGAMARLYFSNTASGTDRFAQQVLCPTVLYGSSVHCIHPSSSLVLNNQNAAR